MNEHECIPKLNSIPLSEVESSPEIDYLIEPLFPRSSLVSIVGTSDVGKSTFVRQLIICIANGFTDFLGQFPINAVSLSVIYVTSEDAPNIVRTMIEDQAIELGIHDIRLNNIYILSDTTNLEKKLKEDLTNKRFDIIIIDTFADIFLRQDGDFYKSTDVRTKLKKFDELASEFQCCVLFVHHIGKGKERDDPDKNSIQGSQAFEAKMRTVIELRQDKSDLAKRHLCITKGNYLPPEYKREVFELVFKNKCFVYSGEKVSKEKLLKLKGKENKDSAIIKMLEQGKQYSAIQDALKVSASSISSVKKRYSITTTIP